MGEAFPMNMPPEEKPKVVVGDVGEPMDAKEKTNEGLEEKKRIALITGTQMERPLRYLAGDVGDDYEADIINLGTETGLYEKVYPHEIKQQVIKLLREKKPELIGFSMIDYGVDRVTDLIKTISTNEEILKNNPKIIVGGPRAIEHREDCLKIEGVDAVCFLTGWHFNEIVEAASKNQLESVPGLLVKQPGTRDDGNPNYITTGLPDLKVTLSDHPKADERLDNSWRLIDGYLINMKGSGGAYPVYHHQLGHQYTGVLVTSEGCLNDCTFCFVAVQKKILNKYIPNKEDKRDRATFLEPTIAIEAIQDFLRANFKTQYILFNDNDFTDREADKVEEFSQLYKKEIGLPFYCQSSPNTATKEKIDSLVSAGMDTFDIGVQGSEKANRSGWYGRACTDDQVRDVAKNISIHLEKRNKRGEVIKEGVKAAFDFINGNPKQTKEDMYSTIDLVKEITQIIKDQTDKKGSWNLAIHNLTLDKNRKLSQKYEKAMMLARQNALNKEGKPTIQNTALSEIAASDYHNAQIEAFYKLEEPYLNIVMEWMGGLHDQVHSGRLPLYSKKFIALIENVLKKDQRLSELLNAKKLSHPKTIDLLTDDEIYSYLGNKKSIEVEEILKQIDQKIPPIHYSYHRKNRYEYDRGFAKKQIRQIKTEEAKSKNLGV